jgi:membrane associated rhomboid family serine protease
LHRGPSGDRYGATMGPITRSLILLNVAIFALQGVFGETLLATYALWPIGRFAIAELHTSVGFHLWQPFTYAFLHGNLLHLSLNMLALYMFGRDVERELGPPQYLSLYGAAVLSAALVQLLVISASDAAQAYPTVGASGGVFGVLLAFGMLFPRRIVVPLFPPIPMPAWLFVSIYGVLELINGVTGTAAGVAHFAHLGGMLGGYLVLHRWRQRALDGDW